MQSEAVARSMVFHALADPSRRAIFESLWRGEAAVKDLTARFSLSQPAVSQHLATLRDAGLVRSRKEGRLVYYELHPQGMAPLIDWLEQYKQFWSSRLEKLEQLLDSMESEESTDDAR